MRYEVRYRSHGQEWGQWWDALPPGVHVEALLQDVDRITFHSLVGLRWQWRISVHPDVT